MLMTCRRFAGYSGRIWMPTHEIVGELPDGYRAVAAVEEAKPDVVIMDSKMPTVSGVETARQIKDRFPEVVVVAYTASGDDVRQRMLGAGAAAVFAKTGP